MNQNATKGSTIHLHAVDEASKINAELNELEIAISNVEANQHAIENRLYPILDPGPDSDGITEKQTAPAVRVVEIISRLSYRLRGVAERQQDVLNRLHV